TGKSKIVIENGALNIQNLKKLRLTVDQLEIRLRNQGISNIKDIKTATLEPNGQLGYELKEDAKPLTVGDFKKIMDSYFLKTSASDQSVASSDATTQQKTSSKPNIFEEIDGQPQQNPKYLR
ncbi:membrane protein, partial [Bacillus thuringiensis]|nr:membrane protein [Bacillus thuringiensis]